MKETLTRNKYLRGAVASLLALAIAGSADACGSPLGHGDGADQRSVDLSNAEASHFQEKARASHVGMQAYKQMLETDTRNGASITFAVGPHDTALRQPFKLGGTLDYVGMFSKTHLTVKTENNTAEVEYSSTQDSPIGSDKEYAIFVNPNEAFFGADGMVTTTELKAFYQDGATQLESFKVTTDYDKHPNCALSLTVDGTTVEYQDNGQNGCPNAVKTPEQFVDYSASHLFSDQR
jgi:hypothetical protein